ncbi:hypothetical protein BHE74_00033340 [Ensete ventricosum]|nr:hypothetical protein BHE74_00033340 [Ensete ventricosum]
MEDPVYCVRGGSALLRGRGGALLGLRQEGLAPIRWLRWQRLFKPRLFNKLAGKQLKSLPTPQAMSVGQKTINLVGLYSDLILHTQQIDLKGVRGCWSAHPSVKITEQLQNAFVITEMGWSDQKSYRGLSGSNFLVRFCSTTILVLEVIIPAVTNYVLVTSGACRKRYFKVNESVRGTEWWKNAPVNSFLDRLRTYLYS